MLKNDGNRRVYGMLGFAMRAGRLMLGTDTVITAIRRGGKAAPMLVLISRDASENTRAMLKSKCEFYKTEYIEIDTSSADLGRLLGKTYAPVCVAVCDEGFAKEIRLAVAKDDQAKAAPADGV